VVAVPSNILVRQFQDTISCLHLTSRKKFIS
jgi:hypothetical protein